MKRIVLLMVGTLVTFSAFAQPTTSKVIDEVTYRGMVMTAPCIVYATLSTNIMTDEKIGFVTIKTGKRNTISREEIESAVTIMEYFQKNLSDTKPENDTRLVFLSAAGTRISFSYDIDALKKGWVCLIQTDPLETAVSIKLSEVEQIIKALKECGKKIDAFLAGE